MPATGDTNPISNSRPTARTTRMIVVNRDLQLRYTGAAVLVGTMTTALTTFLSFSPSMSLKFWSFHAFCLGRSCL